MWVVGPATTWVPVGQPWTQATCTNPVEITSNTTTVYLRSGVVVCSVSLTVTTALAAGQLLFTVPAGYWPPANVSVALYDTTGPVLAPVSILAADGRCTAQFTPVAGRIYRGQIAWPVP